VAGAIVFGVSAVAVVLALALLRERRLRVGLVVLLKRLLERWRQGDALDLDGDRVGRGSAERL